MRCWRNGSTAGKESVGYVALIRDDAGPQTRRLRHRRRRKKPAPGWRHGLRDRIGHQGVHRIAVGGHGRARRGQAHRSGSEISAPRRPPKPFDNEAISLLDLATYTSGLPRLPTNFHPRTGRTPIRITPWSSCINFFPNIRRNTIPDRTTNMPNLGFGLLGHVLSLRAGRSFEELVRAAHLRTAGAEGHAHYVDRVDARAAGAGPRHIAARRLRLGQADSSAAPARFGRPRTI